MQDIAKTSKYKYQSIKFYGIFIIKIYEYRINIRYKDEKVPINENETKPRELLIFLMYAIYRGLRDLRTDNASKKLDSSSVSIESSDRTTGL